MDDPRWSVEFTVKPAYDVEVMPITHVCIEKPIPEERVDGIPDYRGCGKSNLSVVRF